MLHRGCQRKGHGDRQPAIRDRPDTGDAMVGNGVDQRKTQPDPTLGRPRIAALERLEQVGEVGLRHAGAVIRNPQHGGVTRAPDA